MLLNSLHPEIDSSSSIAGAPPTHENHAGEVSNLRAVCVNSGGKP